MKYRIFLACVALIISQVTGFAQAPFADLGLLLHLDTIPSNTPVHLSVHGNVDHVERLTRQYNGRFKFGDRGVSNICIQSQDVLNFADEDGVRLGPYHSGGTHLLNDTSHYHTDVHLVNAGYAPLTTGYTGKGVIVGIVDAGIDWRHGDFNDTLGNTRILRFWDQSKSHDGNEMGYGLICDSADINAGGCGTNDISTEWGHGSHVAGIAAGSGLETGKYTGIAPEANIIAVRIDLYGENNDAPGNMSLQVADAADYIFKVADSLGMPAVVNASLGSYQGAHDPYDGGTIQIESLLDAKAGRAFVCASGNAADKAPWHAYKDLDNDTGFIWMDVENPKNIGSRDGTYIEFYVDTADFKNMSFAFGADLEVADGQWQNRGLTPYYDFWTVTETNGGYVQILDLPLNSHEGNFLSSLHSFVTIDGSRVRVQWFQGFFNGYTATGVDSLDYRYRMQVAGTGRIDVWSSKSLMGYSTLVPDDSLPDVNAFPDVAKYFTTDSTQTMVGYYATSPSAITVGNYSNRDYYLNFEGDTIYSSVPVREISPTSSLGPSRVGLQKPEITAPGHFVISTAKTSLIDLMKTSEPQELADDTLHRQFSGTSMASPHVTGIAALYFEMNPTATWADLKAALLNSATLDELTDPSPSNTWGYGRVNALHTLLGTFDPGELVFEDSVVCDGGTIDIGLSNHWEEYLWSNGASTSSITLTSSASIWATVTNSFGNTALTDTANFIVGTSSPVSISGDTLICNGTNNLFTASTGFETYIWSNGSSTSTTEVGVGNSLSVTVSDVDGCSAQTTVNLAISTPPSVNLIDRTICWHDSTEVQGPSGAANYLWSTGATTSALTIKIAGDYSLTATNSTGCTGLDSMELINPAIPEVGITSDTTYCGEQSTTLSANNGFFGYFWSTGEFSQSISTDTAGTFSLIVADLNGCSHYDTVLVTSLTLPDATVSGDSSICQHESSIFTAPVDNSYFWSTGSTTHEINVDTAGEYLVSVTASNGCQSIGSRTLVVNDLPTPNLGADTTICSNASINLTAGASFAGYNWNTGATTPQIVTDTAGTYILSVTNDFDCQNTDTLVLSVNTIQSVDLGADQFSCVGSAITLTNNGTGSYLWNTGSTSQAITTTKSGQFISWLTDDNNCITSDTIQIIFNASPFVDLGNDSLLCEGGSVTLNAGTHDQYTWSTGATTAEIAISSFGTFGVTVTNSNNCQQSDEITLSNHYPDHNFPMDSAEICDGDTIALDAGAVANGGMYNWQNGDATQLSQVTSTGGYVVEVVDAYGCSHEHTIAVTAVTGSVFHVSGQIMNLDGPAQITLFDTEGDNGYPILHQATSPDGFFGFENLDERGFLLRWTTDETDLVSGSVDGTVLWEDYPPVYSSCAPTDSVIIYPTYNFLSNGTVTIAGTVKSSNGSEIPGVIVALMDMDSVVLGTSTTSDSGTYAFSNINGGNYLVMVDVPGFSNSIPHSLTLPVNAGSIDSTDFTLDSNAVSIAPVVYETNVPEGYWSLINIFPNPTNGLITVSDPNMELQQLEVIGISGQVMLTMKVNGSNIHTMDLSALANGWYQIRMTSHTGMLNTKQIVVNR